MMDVKRLAIVTTHPIQYYAPWFKLLSKEINLDVKVFYTWSQARESVKDKTFGKTISWDIPLLDGYNYEFVENISEEPGTHHKRGIICPELINKIQTWNPHKILVFGWYLKSHFDVMKYFKGKIPIWFRGDSNLLNNEIVLKKFLRRIYLTYVYTKVDKAFYVGTENKKYYKKFGLNEEQLIFAPHAIDNERFFDKDNRYSDEASVWRKELGFNEEDIVILYAGKFETRKQPELLMDAFLEANEKRDIPLKLLLVGNGPLEENLKSQAKNNNQIIFLPFQNQSKMPILYRVCDIFCLPSKSETWGLAINEAMASSKGVIVSNMVGCSTDLVTEKNGFVFPYDKKELLKEILLELTKENCEVLGKISRDVIEQWNFEKIVSSIISQV